MKHNKTKLYRLSGMLGAILTMSLTATSASAKAPCGGLGECKALVEINSSDGDIGFHFLMDGDDLTLSKLQRPDGKTIFKAEALRQLREQFMTETFVESAEPLCFDPTTDDDEENDEEPFVTLADFLLLWPAGQYKFIGFSEDERVVGRTNLTFALPAAPKNLNYDGETGNITWEAGNDLGECATREELTTMVGNGDLPIHPKNVQVVMWEVVFEPDVDDDHPADGMKFTIRVPGDIAVKKIRVPARYRDALPDDTPAKFEVGAINKNDNATFTEEGDVCVNEVEGCLFE